jgi:hypothetical protein
MNASSSIVKLPRSILDPSLSGSDDVDSSSSSDSLLPSAADAHAAGTFLGGEILGHLKRLDDLKPPALTASPSSQVRGAFLGGALQWLVSFGLGAVVLKGVGLAGREAAAATLEAYPLIPGLVQPLVGEQVQKAFRDNHGTRPARDLTGWNNFCMSQKDLMGTLLTGTPKQVQKARDIARKAFNELVLSQGTDDLEKAQRELKGRIEKALKTASPADIEGALADLDGEYKGHIGKRLDEEHDNWQSYLGHVAHAFVRKVVQEDLPLIAWFATLGASGAAAPALLLASVGLTGGTAMFTLVDIGFSLAMGMTAGGTGAMLNNWLRSLWHPEAAAKAGPNHPQVIEWARSTNPQSLMQEAQKAIVALDGKLATVDPGSRAARELRNLRATVEAMQQTASDIDTFHMAARNEPARNARAWRTAIKGTFDTADKRETFFHKAVGNVGTLYLYSFTAVSNLSKSMAALSSGIASGSSRMDDLVVDAATAGSTIGVAFGAIYGCRTLVTTISHFTLGVAWSAIRTAVERCCGTDDDEGQAATVKPNLNLNIDPSAHGMDAINAGEKSEVGESIARDKRSLDREFDDVTNEENIDASPGPVVSLEAPSPTKDRPDPDRG